MDTKTGSTRENPSSTADDTIAELVRTLAINARAASLSLATLPTATKNKLLEDLAALLESNAEPLQVENRKDIEAGRATGLRPALLDRLDLTPKRMASMIDGVRQVAALPDPVGETIEESTHKTGFTLRKVRVPIGVIGIIYESRPNVTIDCAALCFKSGNASILRGGKEAFHTNTFLAGLVSQALRRNGIDEHAVQFIPTTDRNALNALLKLDDYVHCIIPRGGESLIRFVAENARMPVIKHYKGVCNVYVDLEADPAKAASIVVNAKCQRPSVCNAAENLVIHETAADKLLPDIARDLARHEVTLRGDEAACRILESAGISCAKATEEDYHEEYLDLILAIKVVPDADAAIAFINTYGSAHSDAIITENADIANRFLQGVDAATVYWNASTRFTDGYEFGLGAEIGISTDKLHARGPMGLRELTTYKYHILGQGQIRE